MSELFMLDDRISPNLVVLCSTSTDIFNKLFLAALDWGKTRYRKTHYVRRERFLRIPEVPTEYFADPAQLKTIRFYYTGDRPLEKASFLSLDHRLRDNETLIIVETDGDSCLTEHAIANTLALLASFSTQKRRSIISLPLNDDIIMLASLSTKHIYVVNDDGGLTKALN